MIIAIIRTILSSYRIVGEAAGGELISSRSAATSAHQIEALQHGVAFIALTLCSSQPDVGRRTRHVAF